MRHRPDKSYQQQAHPREKRYATQVLTGWRGLTVVVLLAGGLLAIGVRRTVSSPAAPTPAPRAQTQATSGASDPPGTIDGSKNPELIPDELAYKMVLLSLIEPQNPTDAQKARQGAKIRMTGLSDGDAAALLATVGEFRDQLATIDSQVAQIHARDPIPSPNSTDWQQLAQLQKQKDQFVSDTILVLTGRLSSDGLKKLQAHIWNIKHGIKRVPTAVQATY